MGDSNEDRDYAQRYAEARRRLGLDASDWHGWTPTTISREEFDADRRGVLDRARAGECIEIIYGDERVHLGVPPSEGELRMIVRRDAERIAELEAQVRRLQRSDGPMLGPEPPPRWPCPKCGKGTWVEFGGGRLCDDHECGGRIPAGEWSFIEPEWRGGDDG